MPKVIAMPGGQYVQFPDEMSNDDISAALAPHTSAGGTFADHALNSGMMGFSDEAEAGYKALAKKVLPAALGGTDLPLGEQYRQDRDVSRQRLSEEKQEHPKVALGADIAGAILPAVATLGGGTPASAPSTAMRLLRAAVSGGALGGVSALGSSDKEDLGGMAADAGKGAAVGAGLGMGFSQAGQLTGPLSKWLRGQAVDTGRRFLSGTSTSLSRAKPLSDPAVLEAFAQGAIKPGTSIASAAEKLAAAREDVGNVYGRIIDALDANGIRGPEAEALAQKFAAEGRSVAASNTNPAVRGVYDNEAQALTAREPGGAFTVDRDPSGLLRLRQAESMKQSLQDRARSAYAQQFPKEVGEANMGAASMMRQANEDAITQGAAASGDPMTQAIAEGFVPVKDKLGRIIQAADAATMAAQRAQKNHAIGLKELLMSGGNPVKLGGAMLLKTRGTSTVAAGAMKASEMLDGAQPDSPLRLLLLREAQQRLGAPNASQQ